MNSIRSGRTPGSSLPLALSILFLKELFTFFKTVFAGLPKWPENFWEKGQTLWFCPCVTSLQFLHTQLCPLAAGIPGPTESPTLNASASILSERMVQGGGQSTASGSISQSFCCRWLWVVSVVTALTNTALWGLVMAPGIYVC